MFNKNKFAQVLKNINETYSSQRDFAKKSEINRTYLSQYMNMKLDDPPTPKTLKKLAYSSNGITTYEALMVICGYISNDNSSNATLLALYEELNVLEEKHRKNRDKIGLTYEESNIAYDLHQQIYDHLLCKQQTPESFDPNNILNDLDFISDTSRKKIYNELKENFNYHYYKENIRKQINNIELSNSEHYKNSQKPDKQNLKGKYFMTPVYRSNLSRTT